MRAMIRILPVLAGAAAGAIVALAIGGGSGKNSTTTTVIRQANSSPLAASAIPSRSLSINQIYKQDSPGVVDILVTSVASNSNTGAFGFGFGGGGQQEQQGEGAGVVYNTNGDILTDEHVVANAVSVTVTLQDGRKYKAKVLGTDASDDVGVIKINAPASELHPIPLANSNSAQVGDPVVAIGSPFSLPETTTQGIVSAVGRSIQAPNGYTITGAIQTDAAINPGNSGGPLLNASGFVLGLNDQIETNNTTAGGQGSSSGVGFAVPSNTVARIANAIIAGHPVKHPYVGVELNGNATGGAQVSSVEAGSPATNAGLEPGDLITAVDGKAIASTEQFISVVNNFSPGQTINLTVVRNGTTHKIKLTLGNRPSQTPSTG
jgi:putative serine protease PepD